MGFSLFSSLRKKSPETQFWSWFEKNQDMLFYFEKDQERIFDKLQAALSRVHPDITFEFGPNVNGTREFVISADGLKDAFPVVKSLFLSAPTLSRWKFIEFRPRRSAMTIQINGLKLEPTDLEVAFEADGNKAGLTVFVKGYDESRKNNFSQAVYIMLDQAIGEFDMETKVGFIEVKPFEEESQGKRHSFSSLAQVFDEFLAK